MKTLQWHEVLSLAVKQSERWAVYVSNALGDTQRDDDVWEFIRESFHAMYSTTRNDENNFHSENDEAHMSMLCSGLVLFDTEEEMLKFYSVFEQPLTDSSGVYACTFGPDGKCLTENT
jgi:hypothetical protein